MYPVSNAFLEAVKANTRKYYWTGRITTTAGDVYDFDQDDIVKGSGYITSQCCGFVPEDPFDYLKIKLYIYIKNWMEMRYAEIPADKWRDNRLE